MTRCRDHEACYWCGTPLAGRHEHDHVPPRRHGGTDTVAACMNCHELKDRTLLLDWPLEVVVAAFNDIPPGPAKLLMGKLHALALDAEEFGIRKRPRAS